MAINRKFEAKDIKLPGGTPNWKPKHDLFEFLKANNVEIQVNTHCPKCQFDYLSLKNNEVHVCGEDRVVNVIDPKVLESIE